MNDLIRLAAELNVAGAIYDITFALGFVSVFAFVILYGMRSGLPFWKLLITVLTVYPSVVLWMFVMFWIESGFQSFGGNNIVRVFVYVPLAAIPVAKMLKVKWQDLCAVLAFGPVSVQAVSHIGCIFAGCCMGYPSAWGLYNIQTKDIRFPIQIIEVLISWSVITYLLIRGKKRNYVSDGYEYPNMLIAFGFTRFICEFFRDNEKLFLGCSGLAFHALFMFLVGVVWVCILRRKQAQQSNEM